MSAELAMGAEKRPFHGALRGASDPKSRRSRARLLMFKGELPHAPPPTASLMPNSVVYKAQTNRVLEERAKLTDAQRTWAGNGLLCFQSCSPCMAAYVAGHQGQGMLLDEVGSCRRARAPPPQVLPESPAFHRTYAA